MGPFLIILAFLALSGSGVFFAYAILQPIGQKLKQKKAVRVSRFWISDLLCLALLLHLPLTFLAAARSWHTLYELATFGGLLLLFVCVLWWMGVVIASTLGIEQPLRRAVFLVVVLPVVTVGSLLAVPVAIGHLLFQVTRGDITPLRCAAGLAGPLTLFVVCYATRRVVIWVSSAAKTPDSQPPQQG